MKFTKNYIAHNPSGEWEYYIIYRLVIIKNLDIEYKKTISEEEYYSRGE